MQVYKYQHADGTTDYAPYVLSRHPSMTDYAAHWQDAMIMKARTLAASRGATPAEIQREVLKLED